MPTLFPRKARLSVQTRSWAFAVIMIAAGLAMAEAPGSANEIPEHLVEPIHRWVTLCNALPSVTGRIGAITAGEVYDGLSVLQAGELSSQLSHIHQDEACLSLAGSSASQMPTLSLIAHIDAKDRERFGSATQHMARFYKREHLARRLTRLGVDLAAALADSPSAKLDPVAAQTSRNRGILMSAEYAHRSYSVRANGTCILSLEPEPMQNHLKTHNPEAWELLDTHSRAALAQTGTALEFWHEVGHCNIQQTAQTISQGRSSLDQSLMQARADEQARVIADQAACAAPETGLIAALGGPAKAENRLLDAANGTPIALQSNTPLASAEERAVYLNQQIYQRLLEESLADRYAVLQTSGRLESASGACTNTEAVDHPWYRLRLTWSITEPDARYMTWATPWLAGQPETVQHQVMVDAFQGMVRAAKDTQSPERYQEILAARDKRPATYEAIDPNGVADTRRAHAWSTWGQNQIRQWQAQVPVSR